MKTLYFLFFFIVTFFSARLYAGETNKNKHPNIIIIMTDDQGYGDLGYTGNPHVKTPHINKLAETSVRFNQFYVSPVCSPTRASLMTGRYSLRTGIRDTYNGGSSMATDEITIAEMLKQANYRTGIFGKWHLGDNYPMRPMDQGFNESVIHLAGGMGQVGDVTTFFRRDSSYFDPILWKNGAQEAYIGYCTDIFTDEAIEFIRASKENPFFCYLAYNAPHTPLQAPDEYYQRHKNIDPARGFGEDTRPFPSMSDKDKEDARKVYAMVANIDDNVGRLINELEELSIRDNTVIIFLSDNGPAQARYNAGMRDLKATVYQGGIRVPFYLHYPAGMLQNKDMEQMAAHIDILPTIAELCNVEFPKDRTIDGQSLLPLMKNTTIPNEKRDLFFYWSRKYPVQYDNMAILTVKYKLVGNTDYNAGINQFELFDLKNDPFEQHNLVKENNEKARELRTTLDSIYNELIQSPNLTNQPQIIIGSHHENPVILNRNDASGERRIWAQEEIFGSWRVHIKAGSYNIRFRFIKPVQAGGTMYLETNALVKQQKNESENTEIIEMKNITFPELDGELIPFYEINKRNILPLWVEMERTDI